MAYTPTSNYGLAMPNLGDPADIEVLNQFMTEKVDELLYENRQISAPPFSTETAYTAGEMCVYENVLYKFTADKAAGNWDSTKVTATNLADEVTDAAQSGGTTVVANPSAPATEDLNKLQVENTVYGIPDPTVTKTATGNPIEITDGADAPLVKCVTQITGSQDLHGYDKPWVGGAGKNKLDTILSDIKALNTTGTWTGNNYSVNGIVFSILTDSANNVIGIKATGTASANSTLVVCNNPGLIEETNYFLTGCPAGGSDSKYRLSYSNNVDNAYADYGSSVQITEFSHSYQFRTVRITIFNEYSIPTNGLVFYPMIRLSTVTDPTFTPYSNICPITAYTEGEIEVRGKNLLDTDNPSEENYAFGLSGGVATKLSNNSWNISNYIRITGGSYTFSGMSISYNSNTCCFEFSDEHKNVISINSVTNVNYLTEGFTISPPNNAVFVRVSYKKIDAPLNSLQFEKGTAKTPYEPYTSTAHTTTYPSAIYRGSEDVVKGEVTTEWGMIASYAGETLPGEWISDRDEYAPGTTPTTGAQVAYSLATPTTSSVTTTNLPIKSLSGYNHIESSTGEMEVEYITQGYQPIVDLIDAAADTKHAYSTTEHVVGKWVDGKDVYEKTYTFSSLPAVNDWTAFDEDCGIDTLVDYSLMYTRQNGQVDNNTDMLRVAYNPPTGLGDLCYYPGGVGATHITVRYTKSTATTRSLSKGATDSLRADLSEVKDESEEVTEKTEEPVEEPTEKEENER